MQLALSLPRQYRLEGRLKLLGQHAQQLFRRNGLYAAVSAHDLVIVVFYRRGQIAGEYLACVVIQRNGGAGLRVAVDAVNVAANNSQRVRDHRNHVAVLLNVFMYRIAHQAPALDVTHARDQRKKIAVHFRSPLLE